MQTYIEQKEARKENRANVWTNLTDADRELDWKLLKSGAATIKSLANRRGLEPGQYYGWLANVATRRRDVAVSDAVEALKTKRITNSNEKQKPKHDYIRIIQYSVSSHEEIVTVILEHYNTSLREIRGSGQRKDVVMVRWAIAYYLQKIGWSYLKIGRLINRDHTSVLNAVRKYRVDEELAKKILE